MNPYSCPLQKCNTCIYTHTYINTCVHVYIYISFKKGTNAHTGKLEQSKSILYLFALDFPVAASACHWHLPETLHRLPLNPQGLNQLLGNVLCIFTTTGVVQHCSQHCSQRTQSHAGSAHCWTEDCLICLWRRIPKGFQYAFELARHDFVVFQVSLKHSTSLFTLNCIMWDCHHCHSTLDNYSSFIWSFWGLNLQSGCCVVADS